MKKVLAARMSGEDPGGSGQGLAPPTPQGGPYQKRAGLERALSGRARARSGGPEGLR